MRKPLIAIPIGDCAGVGPEITVKALKSDVVRQSADCIVIGSRRVLERTIAASTASLVGKR